ncbi:RagB/SusD family nutrient uptake outer membrane protein [Chitinophaga qingshengii]|uniref:RagB/SusD family nutrient uptake outer membrane protein n=1 Tax=Chitinophaga qingshengii TaxID=1569794 RepID=A0ABR7TXH3_9BACT|nr:RagB/SusD family nutrient uptake outer membrane protein [Chitinophaga qingshengii]MBC9934743.1 RagB/SusD family nutrient uptake outer membrane protein [Chitinophaga qingshengii]
MKKNIIRKTIQLALCGAVLIGAGSGCKKFLEEQDPSNLSPDSYFTLPEHADAAVLGAYARLRFIGEGAGIFTNNYAFLDAATGTVISKTAQNSDLNNLLGLVYDGDNLQIGNWWKGLYKEIAQANLVIDNVPRINPMDENARKRVMGEAYFLRAWAYFYAVRLWGDVPLILKSQTPQSPDFSPGRTSQEEVYKSIVDDLQKAEAAGLVWKDNTGRASTAAVKALLSKVYLTMAGFPLNKGQAYYKLAADKAKEVIDYANAHTSEIGLFTNYADLHNVATNNRLEFLFQVGYLSGVEENPLQTTMLPNNAQPDISAKGSGQGTYVPSQSFYNSYKKFEPTDKRTDQQQFFYTYYFFKGSQDTIQLVTPYIYKFFDVTCHGAYGKPGTGISNLNLTLIRYAEVLLTYAEAQNRADGAPNSDAYTALNAIRQRANLPAKAGLSQSDFEQAVWRERWHELCYEGVTWFDMLRLRKVYNEDTNGFDDFIGHVNKPNGAVLAKKHLLYPLPVFEMKNNPNLKPQNEGY